MSTDNAYEQLREQYQRYRLTDIAEALMVANEQNDHAQFGKYLKASASERTADQLRELCVEGNYDAAELVRFFEAVDKLATAQIERNLPKGTGL